MARKGRPKGKMGGLAKALTMEGSQVSNGTHRGPKAVRTGTGSFRDRKMKGGM